MAKKTHDRSYKVLQAQKKEALHKRQVANILKRLRYEPRVFIHDKALLPQLLYHGVIIEKVITDNILYVGGLGGRGAVTPSMVRHWIKSGRLDKEGIKKYVRDTNKTITPDALAETCAVFDLPPTYKNCKKMVEWEQSGMSGKGVFWYYPVIKKSKFYAIQLK